MCTLSIKETPPWEVEYLNSATHPPPRETLQSASLFNSQPVEKCLFLINSIKGGTIILLVFHQGNAPGS